MCIDKLNKIKNATDRTILIKNLYDKLEHTKDIITSQNSVLEENKIYVDAKRSFDHTKLFTIKQKVPKNINYTVENNSCSLCSDEIYDDSFMEKIKGIKKRVNVLNGDVSFNRLVDHCKKCPSYEYYKQLNENNLNIALMLVDELQASDKNFNSLLQLYLYSIKSDQITEPFTSDKTNYLRNLELRCSEYKNRVTLLENETKKLTEHHEEIKEILKSHNASLSRIHDSYEKHLMNQINVLNVTNNKMTNNNKITNYNFIWSNFNTQATNINKTKTEFLELLYTVKNVPKYISGVIENEVVNEIYDIIWYKNNSDNSDSSEDNSDSTVSVDNSNSQIHKKKK